MDTESRLGGLCSLLFSILWAVGTTLYVISVGSPSTSLPRDALIEAMRHPGYQFAFYWVWPFAWIAALVVAPVLYIHLRDRAPALSLAGMIFLLANAGYQFLGGAAYRVAIALAQEETVDQAQLDHLLALSNSGYVYLLTVGALAMLSWGLVLRKGKGLEALAGWAFLVAFASMLAWKVLGTGPLAEVMHELMVVSGLILPYGAMGIVLLRKSSTPASSQG